MARYVLEARALQQEGAADGTVEVIYLKASHGMGRLYAQGGWSLQNMPRWLRHTLILLLFSDIDIKNCHACLLVQWIKKVGKEVPPELARYAGEDRDAMLGELMAATRWEWGDAKDFVIMIINGGRATSGIRSRGWCRRGCIRS